MTVKRLLVVLPTVALLAACGGDAPADDGRAASGEVLEGTISDDMLSVERVRSEPPLEDPEAFAKARNAADGAKGADAAEGGEGAAVEPPAAEEAEATTPEAAPEAGAE
jgi:hypothetical protein